jgi:hypothetical protein
MLAADYERAGFREFHQLGGFAIEPAALRPT